MELNGLSLSTDCFVAWQSQDTGAARLWGRHLPWFPMGCLHPPISALK